MNGLEKHPKRPRDINQRAASTVALATGQVEETPKTLPIPEPTAEERHIAAAVLGKRGGQSRAKKLSPEQRKEISHKAALARWTRHS